MPFIKWGENMEDRDVQFPNRYRITKVEGTDDIYDFEPVPGEVTEDGSLVNKSLLFSDIAAGMFGLFGNDATPNKAFEWLGKFNQHWWKKTAIASGESFYVYSADRSAYPDSGEQDGYEYQYLGVPFEDLPNAPKIETGSYTGTGKYGSSNPNKLTFDGTPVYCVIFGTEKTKSYVYYGFLSFGSPVGAYLRNPSTGSTVQGTMIYSTFSKDSISWYTTQGNEEQLNRPDIEYFYVALCL